MRFAEFREIQSGDLFRFLDLPLVRLDLLLQLVDQILHTLVVLAIFVGLEAKLLDATFGFAEILLGIGVSPLLSVEFVLQFADALLQFLDRLLAALQSVRLGLVQTHLELLDLGLERFAKFLLGLGVILLGSKLVRQSRGVHHRLLRFLLRVLRLVQQLVQIGVKGLKFGLEFPLGGGDGGVLGAQFVQLLVAVGQLLLGLAAAAVRLLEKGAALLELVLEGVRPAFRNS